eukprot:TRINITY_DN1301_c0_g1_i4.p1 TRINITY_DN1301_c0_g1~~TRINITY_DN1301_c0_g1_i4.p1  ORF type:complete len:470 (-),score=75.30 TRINITY_DN1301_c0_g1_i4:171-1580(-)
MCIRDRYQRRVRGAHPRWHRDSEESTSMPAKKNKKVDVSATPEMEAFGDEVKEALNKLKSEQIQQKVAHNTERGKTSLSLSNKRLNELPEEVANLPECEWIDVSQNNLERLPDALFERCTALQRLDLSRNQITDLPDSIGHLSSLSELHLQSNDLSHLPKTLGDLRLLRVLDFSSNGLGSFPLEIGSCHLLRELRCAHNQVQVLPDDAEWCLLERLDALDNLITTLPSSLGSWLACRSINLACNAITELPAAIGELAQLTELNLNDNSLKTLPVEFNKLVSLEVTACPLLCPVLCLSCCPVLLRCLAYCVPWCSECHVPRCFVWARTTCRTSETMWSHSHCSPTWSSSPSSFCTRTTSPRCLPSLGTSPRWFDSLQPTTSSRASLLAWLAGRSSRSSTCPTTTSRASHPRLGRSGSSRSCRWRTTLCWRAFRREWRRTGHCCRWTSATAQRSWLWTSNSMHCRIVGGMG